MMNIQLLVISNDEYTAAGAKIISEVKDLYGMAEVIVKVRAPLPAEFSLMQPSILFCMFHSEQNKQNIYYAGLQDLVIVEMEQIRDAKNYRLVNQTDITGEAGVYYALRHSQKMPSDMFAVVLGYGNVSSGALNTCYRLGINTKILRKSEYKFISWYLKNADLLINGIAWPENARLKREYIVSRDDIKNSSKTLIVLDLSVDFPNPIETIRPTDYSQPYYLEEGRVHISIYGYPGLFPVTSSRIYSEQVEPLILLIADNNGLKGIGNRGDLGAAIKKAILEPRKMNFEQYKPSDIQQGSRIE
ncbi:hypothetical protein HZA96_03020 [Candidatus Woesearchaeota archaeon]|nr:hypothetical protein [Candidatus Woesearchaeota archaeon]